MIDANLLLLFVVGLQSPRSTTFKKISGFSFADFELLRDFLAQASSLITTAHVLTEVSNLAGSASGDLRLQLFGRIASLSQMLEEQTTPAINLCQLAEFRRFGLTDAALAQLTAKVILLTEDVPLASYLKNKSLMAMTLKDIKNLREPPHGR